MTKKGEDNNHFLSILLGIYDVGERRISCSYVFNVIILTSTTKYSQTRKNKGRLEMVALKVLRQRFCLSHLQDIMIARDL